VASRVETAAQAALFQLNDVIDHIAETRDHACEVVLLTSELEGSHRESLLRLIGSVHEAKRYADTVADILKRGLFIETDPELVRPKRLTDRITRSGSKKR
jgi:hypothetical protein